MTKKMETGRPQRSCKKTSSYREDFCVPETRTKRKERHNTNRLYSVEILDRDYSNKKIKVHYIGYDNKEDQWLDCDGECPVVKFNNISPVNSVSYTDRLNIFLDTCRLEIKKRLQIHRLIDPEERVEITGDEVLFQELFSCCVQKIIRGTSYHYPRKLEDLNHLLGRNWDKRILDPSGDYAYIVEDTVLISVSRRRPIK